MPRADLLIQLVQSGGKGDKVLFKKVVEAIIAEERSKQHNVFAQKLEESLNLINLTSPSTVVSGGNRFPDSKPYLDEIFPLQTLDDVLINFNNRRIIDEFIEEQIRADLLRSYNMEPRNRILLIGPPGNGKTSLAEAIANSLMLPLLTVKYEGIIASYLGETANRLNKLFDYIKLQNCVVFFDEFDSIGKERGDIHETGEIKRVVSSLLLQIDKLPSYVIVIAATNHPELLDKAVWRRFQIKATLEKPNENEISIYLSKFEERFNIKLGISLDKMAKELLGLSYSEIKDFCYSINRKYILELPSSKSILKSITSEMLNRLKKQDC